MNGMSSNNLPVPGAGNPHRSSPLERAEANPVEHHRVRPDHRTVIRAHQQELGLCGGRTVVDEFADHRHTSRATRSDRRVHTGRGHAEVMGDRHVTAGARRRRGLPLGDQESLPVHLSARSGFHTQLVDVLRVERCALRQRASGRGRGDQDNPTNTSGEQAIRSGQGDVRP